MRRFDRARTVEFLRFCAVGGVGFLVDASVLEVAVHVFGTDPIRGRLLSFSVAVLATFELNRRWAFRSRAARPYLAAFASYLGVQGLGFACNILVYTALYLTLPPPDAVPLLCLVIASGVALGVNYAGASVFVFGRQRA